MTIFNPVPFNYEVSKLKTHLMCAAVMKEYQVVKVSPVGSFGGWGGGQKGGKGDFRLGFRDPTSIGPISL